MNWPENTVRDYAKKYLVTQMGINENDISFEFVIPMGRAKKKADIVVFEAGAKHHRDNIKIVIECKAAHGSPNDDAIGQLKSYMDATNAQEGYVIRQVSGTELLEFIPIEKWTNVKANKLQTEYKHKASFQWDVTNPVPSEYGEKPIAKSRNFPVLSSQAIYYFQLTFAVISLIVAVAFAVIALTRIETNPTNEDDPLGINEFSTEVAEAFVMPTTIPQSQVEPSSSLSPETNDANAEFEKLGNEMLNVGWQGIVWIWEFIGSFGFMAQFVCCILPIAGIFIGIVANIFSNN